jgi:hypothetical protein
MTSQIPQRVSCQSLLKSAADGVADTASARRPNVFDELLCNNANQSCSKVSGGGGPGMSALPTLSRLSNPHLTSPPSVLSTGYLDFDGRLTFQQQMTAETPDWLEVTGQPNVVKPGGMIGYQQDSGRAAPGTRASWRSDCEYRTACHGRRKAPGAPARMAVSLKEKRGLGRPAGSKNKSALTTTAPPKKA